MSFVHATAKSTFRSDAGQFVRGKITPGVRVGVKAFADLVLEEAKSIVPVRTGQLRDSGKVVMTETDKQITGHVVFTAEYAPMIEFGWGILGAAGPHAGPYNYSASIQGYPGTGFLRASLDSAREAGKALFRSQVAAEMKF